MTDVEKERERCVKLVTNVLKLHKDNPMITSVLKRLRSRMEHDSPKQSLKHGGLLNDLTPSVSQEPLGKKT
jgi:hypothetical protein